MTVGTKRKVFFVGAMTGSFLIGWLASRIRAEGRCERAVANAYDYGSTSERANCKKYLKWNAESSMKKLEKCRRECRKEIRRQKGR